MMNIIEHLDELERLYNDLTPFPTGHFAPRKGFYKLGSIKPSRIGITNNVPIADGLWSPELDNLSDGLPIDIQVVSLLMPEALGPKNIAKADLENRIIEVRSCITFDVLTDKTCHIIYLVKWRFRD